MNIDYRFNPSPATTSNLTEAWRLNNEGVSLSKDGDHAGAERLHQRAVDLKIRASGPDDVGVALSRNALGEQQLRLGKLAEAEENLKEAVRIRNGRGSAFDAAVSRESLAQVYEAQGKWNEAREIRKSKPDQMACGNYKCPGQTFALDQLRRCSRCTAVFYCSQSCQSADWRSRHKALCVPTAEQQA